MLWKPPPHFWMNAFTVSQTAHPCTSFLQNAYADMGHEIPKTA